MGEFMKMSDDDLRQMDSMATANRFLVEWDTTPINPVYLRSAYPDAVKENHYHLRYACFAYSSKDNSKSINLWKNFLELVGVELDDDIKLHLLNNKGEILCSNILSGCIIQEVKLCDLDYKSQDVATIDVTFSYNNTKVIDRSDV